MKKTISFYEFQNEFQDCRPDNLRRVKGVV